MRNRMDYILARYKRGRSVDKKVARKRKRKITLLRPEDIIVCESQGKKSLSVLEKEASLPVLPSITGKTS